MNSPISTAAPHPREVGPKQNSFPAVVIISYAKRFAKNTVGVSRKIEGTALRQAVVKIALPAEIETRILADTEFTTAGPELI